MTQEAATPPGYNEQIRRMIREELARLMYSGQSRNMSIGEDGALTIKGGQLRAEYPASEGGELGAYFGALFQDGLYVGTGFLIQAPDGSDLLGARSDAASGIARTMMRDANENVVAGTTFTGDGQGLYRPYIGHGFYRQRYADWTVSTTSGSFEGLWKAEVHKQHPVLSVATQSSMDTAGTTGELRVLVNGVQVGATQSIGFALTVSAITGAVAGAHMDLMTVEIQGRRTSASGALRVEPLHLLGRGT